MGRRNGTSARKSTADEAMFNRSTQLRIRQFRRHRGVTSLIAMMYLVLISSLVLGFYAMTTTSAQLSSNDERIARAYLAADSGMDFMRRQLAKVRVPPHTAPEMSIEFYYPDLGSRMNGTGNLNGGAISRSGNTISIP